MRADADADYQALDADWLCVSIATPCPICGGSSNCRTHTDENFACCLHEPSEWRLDNGGWLHRVGQGVIAACLARVSAEQHPNGAASGVVP